MVNINELLDKFEETIMEEKFIESRSIGDDNNYYVFDYPHEKETEVRNRIESMIIKSQKGAYPSELILFDIYDFTIDLLEKRGFLEMAYQFEEKNGMAFVADTVQSLLSKDGKELKIFIDHIERNSNTESVILVGGIGKIHPIIKAKTILSSLQSTSNQSSTILLFPGTFTGLQLNLFEKISEENYYRALKLLD